MLIAIQNTWIAAAEALKFCQRLTRTSDAATRLSAA
jgi:hypothetical protein